MRIEDYLESTDDRYFVPDSNIESAKVVIFQCYPTAMDLKAKASVSALKTWHGIDLFDGGVSIDEALVGTVYISNVPLYALDDETKGLVDELEGIRLSPRVESRYLRGKFSEKMRKIIENENVKLVSYKLEMFERYYEDFVKTADTELVKRLESRLQSGTLKIVEFPAYTLKQIKRFEECYNDFESALNSIMQ